MQKRRLDLQNLEDLSTGAWILGTGGGGDPYQALLELKQLHAAGHVFDLVDPMDLDDDVLIACVGKMGAPLAIQERLNDGVIIAETITMMQDHIGRRFEAIMIWEVGGANCLQAFLGAAHLGLPVVDCDAMGRAFPQADMTTFAITDLDAHPWTMVDIRRNRLLFAEAEDWSWMERMTRAVCAVIGSAAATCKAPRTGLEAKTCSVLHSASKAIEIGRVVREARSQHRDVVADLLQSQGGIEVFRGKVSDVERRTTQGFLRGRLTIAGLDDNRGAEFELEFQNEFSVGRLDGEVRVTVPDLICVLDAESGEAIGTETIRFGQRVAVIALPAPEILLSEKGLQHVGPRAFGFDLDFASVFARDA